MGTSQSKCGYCSDHAASGHTSLKCDAPSTCVCPCNVGGGHDVAQKTSAIAGGVGLAIGGVVITVLTSGLGGAVVGAMSLGAGLSSTANGVTAAVKKEKMNAASYFIDTGVGVAGGALSGGAGGIALNCTKTAAKVGVGAGLGALAGGVTAAGTEGATVGKKRIDGDTDYQYNPHAVWVGAACGALGGMATGGSGALAKKTAKAFEGSVKRGVTKAATRLTTDAVVGVGDSAIKQAGSAAHGEEFKGSALLTGALAGAAGSAISSVSRNVDDSAAKLATQYNISRGSGKAVSRVAFGAASGVTNAAISKFGNEDEFFSANLVTNALQGAAKIPSAHRSDKSRLERRNGRAEERANNKRSA